MDPSNPVTGAEGANGQGQPAPDGQQEQQPRGEQAGQDPQARPGNAPTTDEGNTGDPDPDGDQNRQAPKTFTQAELDAIVGKEKAKAEARSERRVLRTLQKWQGQQQPSAPAPAGQQQGDSRPTLEQYQGNVEAYTEALTDWKLADRDARQQATQQREAHQSLQQRTEKLYAEAAKIEGFDREAFDELELTPTIVHAMLDADGDIQPHLMSLMAESPDEIARIAKLSPARQAAEIGKLEIKATARKAAPSRVSRAPPPMDGVGARNGSHQGSPEGMPHDEYRKMRAKQGAAWYRGR
jgi:hypothetical protein